MPISDLFTRLNGALLHEINSHSIFRISSFEKEKTRSAVYVRNPIAVDLFGESRLVFCDLFIVYGRVARHCVAPSNSSGRLASTGLSRYVMFLAVTARGPCNMLHRNLTNPSPKYFSRSARSEVMSFKSNSMRNNVIRNSNLIVD